MSTPTALGTSLWTRATPPSSKFTVEFFLPSGADALVVFADNGNENDRFTGLSYNDVTMLSTLTNNTSAYSAVARVLWSPSLPASGNTYNIVATYSAAPATACNLAAVALSGSSQSAFDATFVTNINATDPVSTATITTVASATLIVEGVMGMDARTLTGWLSGQSTVANGTGIFVSVLTGPTPGSDASLNVNLNAAHTRGALMALSFAGVPPAAGGTTSRSRILAQRRRRRS